MTASGSMDTTFTRVMGYTKINIGSSATIKWGNQRLRVALALDTTGSMASAGKIDALKTATKNLLDQLRDAASTNGDVYVSIIPFSKDVNVGRTNHDRPGCNSTTAPTSPGTAPTAPAASRAIRRAASARPRTPARSRAITARAAAPPPARARCRALPARAPAARARCRATPARAVAHRRAHAPIPLRPARAAAPTKCLLEFGLHEAKRMREPSRTWGVGTWTPGPGPPQPGRPASGARRPGPRKPTPPGTAA